MVSIIHSADSFHLKLKTTGKWLGIEMSVAEQIEKDNKKKEKTESKGW